MFLIEKHRQENPQVRSETHTGRTKTPEKCANFMHHEALLSTRSCLPPTPIPLSRQEEPQTQQPADNPPPLHDAATSCKISPTQPVSTAQAKPAAIKPTAAPDLAPLLPPQSSPGTGTIPSPSPTNASTRLPQMMPGGQTAHPPQMQAVATDASAVSVVGDLRPFRDANLTLTAHKLDSATLSGELTTSSCSGGRSSPGSAGVQERQVRRQTQALHSK